MKLLITYLFWINVITFTLMAYDRHNAYYGYWRIPRWLPVLLACLGGFYGYLMALLLFTSDKKGNASPAIPWGHKDSPYTPPDKSPVDDSPVPGWGDKPIEEPGLPDPIANKPTPPDPRDVIDPSPDDTPIRLVGNEIIVVLNSDRPVQDMGLFCRKFRELYPQENLYKVSYYNTTTRMMCLQVPSSERETIMDRLESEIGKVLDFLLTDNYAFSQELMPSSPGFQISEVRRYYEAIQAPMAWDITQGSHDVTVAIVDTYFALDHPDLQGRWRDPINIVTQTRNVLPPAGSTESRINHGSHVAGIAVGSNTGHGAGGMAPYCSWIPISLGSPLYSIHMMEGVLYAIYKGADVINLSLGASFTDDILKRSVDEQFGMASKTGKRLQAVWDYVTKLASERRCVIVWAAGNDDALIALDAAKRSDETIKVSAVNAEGQKTSFSNFGNYQKYHSSYSTLSAPGVDILSCVGNREYARWDGTSMAAPFVTGAVALMKSLDRSLSAREIIGILVETGHKTNPEEHIGPMIQVRDALVRVKKGLAHFDDVIRDEASLLGSWETTKHLILTNDKDEYLDDILVFFHFNSLTEGKLTMRSINAGDIYEARISLMVDKKQVTITQLEKAICTTPGVNPIRIYIYECCADTDGLLFCTAKEDDKESFSFHLRKYEK